MKIDTYFRARASYTLTRYGVGFAYRTVLKTESSWRDIRGLWFNSPFPGDGFQYWIMLSSVPKIKKKVAK